MLSVSFSLFPRVALYRCLGGVVLLAGAASLTPSWAQEEKTPLMQKGAVAISIQDVKAEIPNLAEDVRAKLSAEPDQLRPLVEHLFMRRVFASEARLNGVAEQPEVQRHIAIAQERILADAQLAHLEDAALPQPEVIEKQIRTIYQAEPQRFTIPTENRARHILIAGKDAAARAKIDQILADVRAGADFEKIAREQSADPGSAPKGGDLGYFTQGKMVPEFQAAVDALKNPGDLSPVVRTAFGFHIIRLEDRKPGRLQSFDEVKDQLRAETIAKLKNDARKKEVERVRALGQGDAAALEAFIAEQKALAEKTAGKADQPPSAGKP